MCVMRRRFISGTWRSLFAVLSSIRVEYVERACTSSLPRVVDIYTNMGVEEEGCILRIPSWYTRAKARMHFYKPAQANLLVTLFDPHLNVTLYAQQKEKSYSSIIIIYI